MLRLYLFGAPRIERDGQPIALRRTKALAILTYLAVARRPQERDTLLTLIWPEFDPPSARNNLRRELSLLRDVVGEQLLRAEGTQVALEPGALLWIDLAAFHERREAARALPPASAAWAAALGEAVAQAGDEFLAGFSLPESPAFDEWQFFQRETLREQLAEAIEALLPWHAGRGEDRAAIPLARRWLALDPLHEPARRALIELYARAGQLSAALRCYEEGARLLAEELGATPEPATVALYEAVRSRQLGPRPTSPASALPDTPPAPRETPALPAAEQAPPTAQPSPEIELRAPLTSFVGRERELGELAERLAEPGCRLLTLVGPGGIGKTRLALELAARRGPGFADGALVVALQAAAMPGHIPAAIAGALGATLAGSDEPWGRVADLLRGREQLLVLDNCEQLLDAAPHLAELLGVAPRLRLIVTSREPLRLQEEWLYPLDGLDLPASEAAEGAAAASATQLFLGRAHQARGTPVPPAEHAAVAQICRLVGGMPLAIELAAAWTATLGCAEIATEIQRGLELLEARRRNVPARHRSLQAVLAQSWERLDPEAGAALMRLAVFPGGATREAAVAVAGTTHAILAHLLDHALLRRDPDGRFRLHELVRHEAARRLRATQAAGEVHTACGRYYARLLHELGDGDDERAALLCLEAERENIRAAWPAILDAAAGETLRRLLQAMESFYLIRGPYREGVALLEAAETRLRAAGEEPNARHVLAHLLTNLGFMHIRLGEIARAAARFAESSQLFAAVGLPPLPGTATDPEIGEAILALIRGDFAAAGGWAERVRARSEAHGLLANLAYGWYLLTEAALAQRLLPAALRSAGAALSAAREARHEWLSGYILNQLGQIALALGRPDEADEHFRAGYALREAFDDLEGMALALMGQGECAARRDDHGAAAALFADALAVYRRIGDRGGAASALVGLAAADGARGETHQAWSHLRAALELAVALGYQHVVLDIVTHGAQLLSAAGRAEEALELVAPLLLHPACRGETSERAQRLLLRCEQSLAAASFDAALQRGRQRGVEASVELLRRQHATTGPWPARALGTPAAALPGARGGA